jgi:hypothetical protein
MNQTVEKFCRLRLILPLSTPPVNHRALRTATDQKAHGRPVIKSAVRRLIHPIWKLSESERRSGSLKTLDDEPAAVFSQSGPHRS